MAESGCAAVRIACVEIIPDKRKVVGLVEQAYEGKICLPNFQRVLSKVRLCRPIPL